MSERENILTRIREALTVPALGHGGRLPDVAEQRRVMPVVGATFEEQLELFKKNAAELRADFQIASDRADLESRLRKIRDAELWRRAAAHDGELTNLAVRALELPTLSTSHAFDKNDLAQCDVGISECDALIAQTGSVLVTSRSAGGRALSCLPPHHVVLARRDQLLPDLPAAFGRLSQKYGANLPGMISFITGPSRTGDIERILVLGAHGPKKLTILMV